MEYSARVTHGKLDIMGSHGKLVEILWKKVFTESQNVGGSIGSHGKVHSH